MADDVVRGRRGLDEAVAVPTPIGIIFGKNPEPIFGLVVDDVTEGLSGGRAGLRVGDQLLAVGNQVAVGKDFNSVMETLQDGPSTLSLVMYRSGTQQSTRRGRDPLRR